jgi:hypothetical protein
MADIDTKKFPKIAIELDSDPSTLKELALYIEGMPPTDPGIAELQAAAVGGVSEYANLLAALPQRTKIDKSSFNKKTVQGKDVWSKTIDTPYPKILRAFGYCKYDSTDKAAQLPVAVRMFTTTANNQASSTMSDTEKAGLLEGVWAYSFTMTLQVVKAAYVGKCVMDILVPTELLNVGTAIIGEATKVIGIILAPPIPDPKAIAAKLLGPAATEIQNGISKAMQQLVQYKPYIDMATTLASIVQNIPNDPLNSLIALLAFALELIPEDQFIQLPFVYPLRGGA